MTHKTFASQSRIWKSLVLFYSFNFSVEILCILMNSTFSFNSLNILIIAALKFSSDKCNTWPTQNQILLPHLFPQYGSNFPVSLHVY